MTNNYFFSLHFLGLLVWVFSSLSVTRTHSQTLAALTPQQTAAIVASGTSPYALITNSYDVTMERVHLLSLDPKTLQPIARGEFEPLRCARLHGNAKGEVICLGSQHLNKGKLEFGTPHAMFFARPYAVSQSDFMAQGSPRINRARLSADGKHQAWTYLSKGDSYLQAGTTQFSTITQISSLENGSFNPPSNLESWTLMHDGSVVKSPDLNYWGVTFHPSITHQFLVTAFYKGKAYLAQGDIRSKKITLIHEGVECPSYSPDGTKIAFKKRVNLTEWKPATLELSSKKETVFSHLKGSVDDQIDWLDKQTLLFEFANVPLVGIATIGLVTLNTNETMPQPKMWANDARSAAIYRPKK